MGGIDGKVEDTACTVRAIGMEAHSGGRTACLISANDSPMAEPATRIVASVSKGMPNAQAKARPMAPYCTPTKKAAGMMSAPIAEMRAVSRGKPRALSAGLKRSEEHTSELQSLMRISSAVF